VKWQWGGTGAADAELLPVSVEGQAPDLSATDARQIIDSRPDQQRDAGQLQPPFHLVSITC
jgi:hypothetical protein